MRPGHTTLAAVAAQRFDDMRLGVFACDFYRGKTAGFSIATNLASCHFFPRHGLASCLRGPVLLPSRTSGGQRARFLWGTDTKMPRGAPVGTPRGIQALLAEYPGRIHIHSLNPYCLGPLAIFDRSATKKTYTFEGLTPFRGSKVYAITPRNPSHNFPAPRCV